MLVHLLYVLLVMIISFPYHGLLFWIILCIFWIVVRVWQALWTCEKSGQLWSVCVWDAYTGTSVMSYRGSSSQPRTLCFVRDDYVLTSASNKPLINVWSMQRQVITYCNIFTPRVQRSYRSERGVYEISVRSMNIDDPRYDRPTDWPQGLFTHIEKFQMAITLQHVNRSPWCLVLGWGFRGRRIKRRHFRLDQIQDGGHFEKLQMAISLRRVVRSTLCLVLGWGFRGQRIEQRHFRLYPTAVL